MSSGYDVIAFGGGSPGEYCAVSGRQGRGHAACLPSQVGTLATHILIWCALPNVGWRNMSKAPTFPHCFEKENDDVRNVGSRAQPYGAIGLRNSMASAPVGKFVRGHKQSRTQYSRAGEILHVDGGQKAGQ